MQSAHLRVPASSANLGPGFDALGLALDLYLDCRFQPSSHLLISASGADAKSIPLDESNLIWQTALRVAESAGAAMHPVDLAIQNSIPLGKGLGSSAAALTAGVVIANHILGLGWSRERILHEAARLEGHPDNVAACVLGGIAVSALDEKGQACALRLEMPEGCSIALLIPDSVLPTSQSRAVLPNNYCREDVVFNLQRMGLLVAAFGAGRLDLLPAALADRIHQPYRSPLIPGFQEILGLRLPDLFGCVLSGAGPSVLVFYRRGGTGVLEEISATMQRYDPAARVMPIAVAPNGFALQTVTG